MIGNFGVSVKSKLTLILLLVIPVAPCLAVGATQFNANMFSGMQWRNIGPYRGGRADTVAGVASKPNVFYQGSVGGGVWETDDAGWHWRSISDDMPVSSIGSIAVSPSDPNVIYVGTGENDPRPQESSGAGMYKSVNAGKTWSYIGLAKTKHIGKVIVDPKNPNRVFVAALGKVYGANSERGVYRTLDGGKTWTKVLYKNPDVGAIDLAFDPDNSQIIYAALWATRRPPWWVYPPSTSPGSGIFKSTDGGATWRQLTAGLPTEAVGKIGIAVAPTDPNRVYAIIDAKEGGLYRSDDAGSSWKLMDASTAIWGRGWYFDRVTVDPKNENVVYITNFSLYRSTDGGSSFVAFRGVPQGNDTHSLWIDPDDTSRMALASDHGTIITVNGGKTWSSHDNQPTSQYYYITADNRHPFWIHGPIQDEMGHSVASSVSNGRITYRDWAPTCVGGEQNQVLADPLGTSELYSGTTKCNMLTGAVQNISPLVAYPDQTFKRNETTPIAFSMAGKHAYYFGNQYLWQTINGGDTWKLISPNLSRKHAHIPPNLNAAAAGDMPSWMKAEGPPWGFIKTIAPSPLQAATIWVGTNDGLIWLTRDDGKTWNNVTPSSLKPWYRVMMMSASHFDANTVYAAIDLHKLGNDTPHILRSVNYGKTWQEVVRGLPKDAYVQAVKQDPHREGMLWAGTSVGVYLSFDRGNNWESLRLNMPSVAVRDFAFKDNSVAIATFGRGAWVLDDLNPLRQINAAISDSLVYLYKPEPAILWQLGRPVPDRAVKPPIADAEPIQVWSGEPRMKGAIIDYYLKANATGPVTLDILDSDGKVIRHYSSANQLVKPQAEMSGLTETGGAAMGYPSEWDAALTSTGRLSGAAGMHRIAWDLREVPSDPGKTPPTGLSALFESVGHEALPGQYTIRLTVDGHDLVRPLSVNAPPNVDYNIADLRAQARMIDSIQVLQDKVATAVHEATRVSKELASLQGRAGGRLANSIKATSQRVQNIEGYVPPPNPNTAGVGGGEPARDSLRGLAGFLRTLDSAVQRTGTESPPRQAVVVGFSKAQSLILAKIGQWKNMKAFDIKELNGALENSHLPPIKP